MSCADTCLVIVVAAAAVDDDNDHDNDDADADDDWKFKLEIIQQGYDNIRFDWTKWKFLVTLLVALEKFMHYCLKEN